MENTLKLKIYMDNCCLARPFDDLTQMIIRNEADAKMYIQSLVKFDSVSLYSSYMLYFEISGIPTESNREHITKFVSDYSAVYIDEEYENEIVPLATEIMDTGVRRKDSIHLACALIAGCDYLITTDKRMLKYKTEKLKVVNPIEFVTMWEETT